MAHVLCIGTAVQDFVFSVPSMPERAEKHRATHFESVGGGPAATAAVAVARLGDDPVAGIVTAELQADGVDCSLVRRFSDRTSSLSSVFVDDKGERLIVNYLDIDMPSATDWLPDAIPAGVDAVLADTRWPDGALYMLQLARNAGLPAVLDADVPVPPDGELVRTATHVAFSAPGLAGLCGDEDPEKGLRIAADSTDAWCGVTLGARGTKYVEAGRIAHVDAYRVTAIDTLGAGDVWHGAFALALAEGQATSDALQFASAAAAVKVRNGGGRAGSPDRHEVEELMQRTLPETLA